MTRTGKLIEATCSELTNTRIRKVEQAYMRWQKLRAERNQRYKKIERGLH